MLKRKLKEAENAILAVACVTSVSEEATLEALESLRDEISSRIEALESEMETREE